MGRQGKAGANGSLRGLFCSLRVLPAGQGRAKRQKIEQGQVKTTPHPLKKKSFPKAGRLHQTAI